MAYGHSIEHRNGGTVHLEPAIDEWYGQTFSALGDSIVWAGAPMLNRMRSRLGFLSYRNLGVSGRPMADGTANGVGTVTTALANNFATDALVYVAVGTNDFRLNVPLGTIGPLAQTSHSRSTFYGAYRTTIDHLLAQNPGIQIVLATPLQRNNKDYSTTTTNTAGHMLRDYRSAIFALGDMYSLPVVDLYALSGISEKTLDRYTTDGLHPNEQGYVHMARVVVGQLRSGGAASGVPELESRVQNVESSVASGAAFQGILTEADADRVDDLPFGWYSIGSGGAATALGMPVAYGGHLFTAPQGSATGIRFFYPWSQPSVGYQSTRPWTGVWSAWSKTQDADLSYDTGWRDLTGALINGWTATSVQVRRDGKWGHLRFRSLNGSQSTRSYFADGLTGFFVGDQNISIKIGDSHLNLWVMGNGSSISLPETAPVSGVTVQVSQYLGDLPKPTTLPGDPA